jgi:two-component system sensor histidine kinase MtrB
VTAVPRFRILPRGLRVRLVAGFALVAVAGVLTTGALTFREARNGLLQQSQDSVVRQFRDYVDALSLQPPVHFDRTQQYLEEVVDQVARTHASQHWVVLATFGSLRAGSGSPDAFDDITPELRGTVQTRAVTAFQRVDRNGVPILVVGTPIAYWADSALALSGLDLYLIVPQETEQASIRALVSAVERATIPALGLAVVLAMLAARGVLRPVRALRSATRRMAEGHLDVRLDVNGGDELADLSRAFNETAAALEASVAELRRMEAQARRFAADVSHELRTPLAAMSAVTDVLDEEVPHLPADTANAVQLVSEETGRLTRLVNDLMEISRFDAHAAVLSLDEIDLAESLRRTLASRGWLHQVQTWLPEPGVLRARVDPRRIDVVVANLVANALRHGAPPVVLSLTTRQSTQGAVAVIEVADGGPGIPPEALPHIFERFYKADTARARSDSSGLGLAITVENVRLHGGRVRAANRPGGGAVFTVELPLHGRPGQAPADSQEVPS